MSTCAEKQSPVLEVHVTKNGLPSRVLLLIAATLLGACATTPVPPAKSKPPVLSSQAEAAHKRPASTTPRKLPSPRLATTPSPGLANWMQTYACAIQNKLLTQLILPASHDSGTAGINSQSVLMKDPYMDETFQAVSNLLGLNWPWLSPWAITQGVVISGQLNAGARYFDVRPSPTVTNTAVWPAVTWSAPAPPFYLVHALNGEETSSAYQSIATFLTQNPQEIVLLDFSFFNMTAALHQQHYAQLISILGPWMVPSSGNVATDLALTVNNLWNPSTAPWLQTAISTIPGYIAPRVIALWSRDRTGSSGISFTNPQTWPDESNQLGVGQYVSLIPDCEGSCFYPADVKTYYDSQLPPSQNGLFNKLKLAITPNASFIETTFTNQITEGEEVWSLQEQLANRMGASLASYLQTWSTNGKLAGVSLIWYDFVDSYGAPEFIVSLNNTGCVAPCGSLLGCGACLAGPVQPGGQVCAFCPNSFGTFTTSGTCVAYTPGSGNFASACPGGGLIGNSNVVGPNAIGALPDYFPGGNICPAPNGTAYCVNNDECNFSGTGCYCTGRNETGCHNAEQASGSGQPLWAPINAACQLSGATCNCIRPTAPVSGTSLGINQIQAESVSDLQCTYSAGPASCFCTQRNLDGTKRLDAQGLPIPCDWTSCQLFAGACRSTASASGSKLPYAPDCVGDGMCSTTPPGTSPLGYCQSVDVRVSGRLCTYLDAGCYCNNTSPQNANAQCQNDAQCTLGGGGAMCNTSSPYVSGALCVDTDGGCFCNNPSAPQCLSDADCSLGGGGLMCNASSGRKGAIAGAYCSYAGGGCWCANPFAPQCSNDNQCSLGGGGGMCNAASGWQSQIAGLNCAYHGAACYCLSAPQCTSSSQCHYEVGGCTSDTGGAWDCCNTGFECNCNSNCPYPANPAQPIVASCPGSSCSTLGQICLQSPGYVCVPSGTTSPPTPTWAQAYPPLTSCPGWSCSYVAQQCNSSGTVYVCVPKARTDGNCNTPPCWYMESELGLGGSVPAAVKRSLFISH